MKTALDRSRRKTRLQLGARSIFRYFSPDFGATHLCCPPRPPPAPGGAPGRCAPESPPPTPGRAPCAGGSHRPVELTSRGQVLGAQEVAVKTGRCTGVSGLRAGVCLSPGPARRPFSGPCSVETAAPTRAQLHFGRAEPLGPRYPCTCLHGSAAGARMVVVYPWVQMRDFLCRVLTFWRIRTPDRKPGRITLMDGFSPRTPNEGTWALLRWSGSTDRTWAWAPTA